MSLTQSANGQAHIINAILFHRQNCANFYTVCNYDMMCARMICENLLAQKLIVESWWDEIDSCSQFH